MNKPNLLLMLAIFVGALVICQCKSGTATYKHSPADTTYPLCIYLTDQGLRSTIFRRVNVDSATYVYQDTLSHKDKDWRRISIYYIALPDSATKRSNYYLVGKGVILADMNINTDSMSKIYPSKVPAVDTSMRVKK